MSLQLLETITRTRIYESMYWKADCFGVNCESIVDRSVALLYVGGLYGNQRPSEFLCLLLKLLQLEPEKEIVLEFIQQPHFKYLRALGAFYLRLTGSGPEIYNTLEPLLSDYRKLRFRKNSGFELIHMDEFVDELLHNDRVFDTILPRLQKRVVLEDNEELKVRKSEIQEEIDELLEQNDYNESKSQESQSEQEQPHPIVETRKEKVKVSKSKLNALFKTPKPQPEEESQQLFHPSSATQEMSIDDTNALRTKLGLKPLKLDPFLKK